MELEKLNRWHLAVIAHFGLMNVGWSAVVVRMPEVKALLGVTSGELGFILLAGAFGSLITLLFGGKLIARVGTKPVLAVGFTVAALSVILTAVAISMESVALTIPIMFIAFAGFASADVSMNLDGSIVEQKLGRTVLPRMHAFYSFGTFLGAAIGTVAVTLGVPLVAQTVVLGALQIAVPLLCWKFMPARTGQDLHHNDQTQEKAAAYSPWKNPAVILLGFGILGVTLAEGASNDWLTLSFVEGLKQNATNAGIAFVILQIGMTTTRFFGGNFVDKFGRRRVLEVSALSGIVGLLLVILSGNIIAAWFGCALWGIGIALGFPLFIGSAGEGKQAARDVSLVATFGYAAFLVGPPLLGLLAQNIGILNMLYVLVFALGAAFYFSRATEKIS